MVVQQLDPSFGGQPHQETNKTLCSASRLHSRLAAVSSTNTKEAIEGKVGPTRRKPRRHGVPADSSASLQRVLAAGCSSAWGGSGEGS